MTMTRRFALFGGAALASLGGVTFALGGMDSFLRRVLADHFGKEILDVDGLDDFIADYVATAGDESTAKRLAAKLYFSWGGDRVYKIGQAETLENLFLHTILTRSNIIAVYQGADQGFEFTFVDPWEPTCGLYLSAFSDPTLDV